MPEPTPIKRVEYVPPTDDTLNQYAYAVCEQMGNEIDPDFNTQEIRHGLAAFMRTVAAIKTRQMNHAE